LVSSCYIRNSLSTLRVSVLSNPNENVEKLESYMAGKFLSFKTIYKDEDTYSSKKDYKGYTKDRKIDLSI
jgi:hypothetical protein